MPNKQDLFIIFFKYHRYVSCQIMKNGDAKQSTFIYIKYHVSI